MARCTFRFTIKAARHAREDIDLGQRTNERFVAGKLPTARRSLAVSFFCLSRAIQPSVATYATPRKRRASAATIPITRGSSDAHMEPAIKAVVICRILRSLAVS